MTRKGTPVADILAQIPAARAAEKRDRRGGLRATSARYDRKSSRVILETTKDYLFGFPVSAIPALAKATPKQLARIQLDPGGSGLHWEELDADLSVPGLFLSSLGRREKLTEFARAAGKTKSPAKAAASRKNGAKGGRPRKSLAR